MNKVPGFYSSDMDDFKMTVLDSHLYLKQKQKHVDSEKIDSWTVRVDELKAVRGCVRDGQLCMTSSLWAGAIGG